jgi:hypothetical protein
MTALPTSLDLAVTLLFRAMVGHARGDALAVMTARSELVALAGATEGFEGQLVTAAVDQLVAWDTCPNATRGELERALQIDVRRHVSNSLRLAETEAWGHA